MSARSEAQAALAHPRLQRLMALIPAADRGNPKEMRSWLAVAAAEDPAGAESAAFKQAHAAVAAWAGVAALSDRAAAIFHDPSLRAEFGAARLEAAWRDPASAYAELVGKSAAGKLSVAANEALQVLSEARMAASDSGVSWEAPSAPLPAGPAAVEREAEQLVKKSAETRLTPAEDRRLRQLYESRTAELERDNAASEASAARPRTPHRREILIRKSATAEGLSERERIELEGIYGRAYPEEDELGFVIAPVWTPTQQAAIAAAKSARAGGQPSSASSRGQQFWTPAEAAAMAARSVERPAGAHPAPLTRREQLLERSVSEAGLSPQETAELHDIYESAHPEEE